MIKTRQQLINHLEQGHNVKFLHFWGHTQKGDKTDKSCLSQWFPASFMIDQHTYLTAEHFMMAQKARLFNDDVRLDAILNCDHPHAAKKFGRQVLNFDADIWNQHCFDYVVQGNIAKFSQNQDLKNFLLNTKERVLVEASPRDRIWGIGMGKDHPDANNPKHWRGENLLGFALMVARQHIQQE